MADPKEQGETSLTQLVSTNSYLTEQLEKHTQARNFLWKVATGELAPPVLEFNLPGAGSAHIDMSQLPQDVVESILLFTIEHEEKLVFDTWDKLAVNSNTACDLINRMKQRRVEELSSDTKDLLPFSEAAD